MVRNSKYLLTLTLLAWLSTGLFAQMSKSKFSPIERDLEISRVTLENFLKKWDGDPLLNRITKANGSYTAGEGVLFSIQAPNARIFFDGRGIWNDKADQDLMDTFYDEEIIELQKTRLKQSIAKFIKDFSDYLPEVDNSESIAFQFEVSDPVNKEGELPVSTPKQNLRTYQVVYSISSNDLSTMNNTQLSISEIENIIKITTK